MLVTCIFTCEKNLNNNPSFLTYQWGNMNISNIKEVHQTDRKNKDATKKIKSFSLFTCTKEEFKEWFDPL